MMDSAETMTWNCRLQEGPSHNLIYWRLRQQGICIDVEAMQALQTEGVHPPHKKNG